MKTGNASAAQQEIKNLAIWKRPGLLERTVKPTKRTFVPGLTPMSLAYPGSVVTDASERKSILAT